MAENLLRESLISQCAAGGVHIHGIAQSRVTSLKFTCFASDRHRFAGEDLQ